MLGYITIYSYLCSMKKAILPHNLKSTFFKQMELLLFFGAYIFIRGLLPRATFDSITFYFSQL